MTAYRILAAVATLAAITTVVTAVAFAETRSAAWLTAHAIALAASICVLVASGAMLSMRAHSIHRRTRRQRRDGWQYELRERQ